MLRNIIVFLSASMASMSCCTGLAFGSQDHLDSAAIDNATARQRLEQLLVTPPCLQSLSDSPRSCTVETVSVASDDIKLSGMLYLPSGSKTHAAVVFMHGGGNDTSLLMAGPRFYAPRLAHCGFAALIYDKRGTGMSGGVFREATLNDFIADAGNAAAFLATHPRIEPSRIGIYGGSEGGQLAPVAAVRYPQIAFVISVSGPIGSLAEQANHNVTYALHARGYSDSLINLVMPLWRRHHGAWESRDTSEFRSLAEEIARLRNSIDPLALPSTWQEIMTDSNLCFLRPGFNSMSRDYTRELAGLRVPLLALYGELDPIVDVQKSVANLKAKMAAGGQNDYEILVVDGVGHSFFNHETGEQTPTENIIVNWLQEKLLSR